jgi:hypothetical protein
MKNLMDSEEIKKRAIDDVLKKVKELFARRL